MVGTVVGVLVFMLLLPLKVLEGVGGFVGVTDNGSESVKVGTVVKDVRWREEVIVWFPSLNEIVLLVFVTCMDVVRTRLAV